MVVPLLRLRMSTNQSNQDQKNVLRVLCILVMSVYLYLRSCKLVYIDHVRIISNCVSVLSVYLYVDMFRITNFEPLENVYLYNKEY